MGAITKNEMREKTMTRTWREYNEELGRYELHQEETSKCVFDEEDKIAIAREYVERGCQYCSGLYVDTLKSRKIQISMTQSGDPLENAVAERANGILKSEWLYRMEPPSKKECSSTLSRIMDFYNDERPHMSIGYKTPSEVHCQSGLQKRCWKNPWESRTDNEKRCTFAPP